jgi:hypothetical protein
MYNGSPILPRFHCNKETVLLLLLLLEVASTKGAFTPLKAANCAAFEVKTPTAFTSALEVFPSHSSSKISLAYRKKTYINMGFFSRPPLIIDKNGPFWYYTLK